jgi:dihydrofolate reductase
MRYVAVVAHDQNLWIGKWGQLPWHNPEDFKHFKSLTTGHTVVMGARTFDSIGRALPNRRNIVLSRSNREFDGAERVDSLESLDSLLSLDDSDEQPSLEVCVLGGSQVYELFLEKWLLDELWVSEIPGIFECDTYFPEYRKLYHEYSRIKHNSFDFVIYRRSTI